MSKFNKLFSKIESYEKMSVYANRTEFLQSLALSNQDVATSINSVRSAVQNWINNDAENQSDLPTGIKGLPPGLRSPYQVVRGTNNFDIETLPKLYQALLDLSTINNLGNMGGNAKSAWLNSVFPVIGTAMQSVKAQLDYLKEWTNNNSSIDRMPLSNEVVQKEVPVQQTKTPQKSLTEQAKSLATSLFNKIDKLSNSVNRAVDLQHINENVKSLQRYFKALQDKNDLQSYFARMEIVKSLQNAYTTLDYNDLDIVSALNSGQGVPETPDSKI